MSALLKPMYM